MSSSPIIPTGEDLIVVVMGPTGAGKSTFIKYASEQDGSTIGHNLRSYTQDISLVRSKRVISRNGRKHPIVFVDTPGFDDTYKSDIEILSLISQWLVKAYKNAWSLASILYFHRISDNRMAGSPLKNLELFASICGNKAMPNVTLVTTMWAHVPLKIGERREKELRDSFWSEMIERGCEVRRFEDSCESALDIVSKSLKTDRALLLTHQIVEKHKALKETEAGITLNKQLQKLLEDQKEAERRLQELASGQENQQARSEMENRASEIGTKIREIAEEMRDLKIKIPLPKRIWRNLFARPAVPNVVR